MNKKLLFLPLSIFLLAACDDNSPPASPKNNDAELEKYIQQIKSNLIFVQGGEFQMGDFGEKYAKEHLPYDENSDSKPLHKVELSNYSIQKFKVNNEEYKSYISFNNVKTRIVNTGPTTKKYWDEVNSIPDTPAHVDWNEADNYCHWLAEVTKLPFSLPTEAQWEYAARSRGEFVIAPTNDGIIRADEGDKSNVASENDTEAYSKKMGTSLGVYSPLPGNLYPPKEGAI